MAEEGERADVFLVAHGFAASRAEAQAAIRAGRVSANGHTIRKPADSIAPDAKIAYAPAHPYVSRGGVKLAAALDHFKLSPKGRVCVDLGASTGGFTEVLLERGAMRVYAVDVGHGQLHRKLAHDERVVAREGVNARDLTSAHMPEPPQVVVADLSFIGLKVALPPALTMAALDAWAVLLVKPQFEAGRGVVGKGGIVRQAAVQERALKDIADWIPSIPGWSVIGTMESPITGGDGNREFLLAAARGAKAG